MSANKINKILYSMDGETLTEMQWKNIVFMLRNSNYVYSRFGNCAMVYNDEQEYKYIIDNSTLAA
jgi:hypothetical protein